MKADSLFVHLHGALAQAEGGNGSAILMQGYAFFLFGITRLFSYLADKAKYEYAKSNR